MKTRLKLGLSCMKDYLLSMLMGIIILFVTAWMGDFWISKLIYTLICSFLCGAFIYSECWRQGFKDRNYVKFGREKADPLKGVFAGLYASIPIAVMTVIYWICSLTSEAAAVLCDTVCRFLAIPLVHYVNTACAQIPWLYIFCALPIIFSTWLGYELGSRDYSLTEHLVFVRKERKRPQMPELTSQQLEELRTARSSKAVSALAAEKSSQKTIVIPEHLRKK